MSMETIYCTSPLYNDFTTKILMIYTIVIMIYIIKIMEMTINASSLAIHTFSTTSQYLFDFDFVQFQLESKQLRQDTG